LADRKNEIFEKGSSEVAVQHTRDVMRDDFGFVVPTETAPLPSQGKVYPEGSPLHGRTSLDITPMTAREEDILTSRALIKRGTVITELIRSCLVDKQVRVEEMLSGDRNALMVAIRITGYGQHYEAEIVCEDCGERSDASFDLATLPIRGLELEPADPGTNIFEFELPVTGAKVQFAFLTGNDEELLLAEHDRRRKKMKLSADSLVTSRLEKSLVSVNGILDRAKIAHFVRRMPAQDSRALRKHMDAHEPGIEMKAWTRCEHCGTDQEVGMPIGAKFFWPDA